MDSKLIVARVNDLKQISNKTNIPKFMGFLTSQETAVAIKQFSQDERYCIFGGYEDAERVMLGVLPEWCDDPYFPISAVTFRYRECDTLSHRDFLGSLMALGITRESVGDILVEKGRAVVFVDEDVEKFVLTQISKVGNVGVEICEGFTVPLPQQSQKQSFSTTVASTRVDAVVASLCNVSRSTATQKINDGYVSINSVCVGKTTAIVKCGDKITIRQKGRFEITSCDGHSKSGRIILKYDKYV